MIQKKIKNHVYDKCDGGVCLNCDLCTYSHCCPQTTECYGHNWDFLNRTPDEWMEWLREANITASD